MMNLRNLLFLHQKIGAHWCESWHPYGHWAPLNDILKDPEKPPDLPGCHKESGQAHDK